MTRSLALLAAPLMLLAGFQVPASIPAHAQTLQSPPVSSTQRVTLKVSTTRVFRFPDPATRIHVLNPKIADVVRYTRNGLHLRALSAGKTAVKVIFRGHQAVILVTVIR